MAISYKQDTIIEKINTRGVFAVIQWKTPRKAKQMKGIVIKEDAAFNKASNYSWMNIEVDNVRVGKLRARSMGKKFIMQSITIFPEFERKGYAKETIDYYKKKYDEIIADRVRNTARIFWVKMEFTNNGDGNYVWKRGFN